MAAAGSERTIMIQPAAKRRHSNSVHDPAGTKRSRTSSCGVSHLDGNVDGSALHWCNLQLVRSAQSDDTESLHSYQGYETTLVKDSSDDLWFLDEEDNLSVSNPGRVTREQSVVSNDPSELEEFEVLSDSSESVVTDASTVDYDEIASADEIFVLCDDSSSDGWADFSSLDNDSDDDSDSGSTRECDSDPDRFQKDMWYCGRCNRMNPPLRGCCDQCWGKRPGWHSETVDGSQRKQNRPRRRQQRKIRKCRSPVVHEEVPCLPSDGSSRVSPGTAMSDSKSDDRISKSSHADVTVSLPVVAQFSRWRNNSSSGSSSSSDSDSEEIRSVEAVTNLRSGGRSLEGSTPAVHRDLPLTVSGSSASSRAMPAGRAPRSFSLCHVDHTDELCVVCLSRKKDASIVHGSTGHQACCYTCAREMQFRMKPCPVCRRPIRKVIRNYFISSR